ncbi:MAG TPA: HDOD domain-containing protein, partial [Planctomycetes bacterium]|nr:HDOD domain-containing protein [Planctomycetota bacterium]
MTPCSTASLTTRTCPRSIPRPWNLSNAITTDSAAVKIERTRNPELEKLVEGIDTLPTLPSIVARVNELVQDPATSASDLNDVISRDLALSGRLLKLVNSSMYGFPRKISSVTHAVVILGFNTVRNVVLSA